MPLACNPASLTTVSIHGMASRAIRPPASQAQASLIMEVCLGNYYFLRFPIDDSITSWSKSVGKYKIIDILSSEELDMRLMCHI